MSDDGTPKEEGTARYSIGRIAELIGRGHLPASERPLPSSDFEATAVRSPRDEVQLIADMLATATPQSPEEAIGDDTDPEVIPVGPDPVVPDTPHAMADSLDEAETQYRPRGLATAAHTLRRKANPSGAIISDHVRRANEIVETRVRNRLRQKVDAVRDFIQTARPVTDPKRRPLTHSTVDITGSGRLGSIAEVGDPPLHLPNSEAIPSPLSDSPTSPMPRYFYPNKPAPTPPRALARASVTVPAPWEPRRGSLPPPPDSRPATHASHSGPGQRLDTLEEIFPDARGRHLESQHGAPVLTVRLRRFGFAAMTLAFIAAAGLVLRVLGPGPFSPTGALALTAAGSLTTASLMTRLLSIVSTPRAIAVVVAAGTAAVGLVVSIWSTGWVAHFSESPWLLWAERAHWSEQLMGILGQMTGFHGPTLVLWTASFLFTIALTASLRAIPQEPI